MKYKKEVDRYQYKAEKKSGYWIDAERKWINILFGLELVVINRDVHACTG